MKMGVARIKTVLIAVFMGLGLMSYQNCSPQGFKFKGQPGPSGEGILQQNGGTTTDNPKPTVSLQVGAFEDVVSGAATPEILLCVSEIRFLKADNDQDDVRIDLNGEKQFIALKPEGTVLDLIDVPVGNYGRIELRLEANCAGASAAVKNSNGEFATSDEVHVRFRGSIANNGNIKRLILDMDQMVEGLAVAKNRSDVEEALTDSEGGCDDD